MNSHDRRFLRRVRGEHAGVIRTVVAAALCSSMAAMSPLAATLGRSTATAAAAEVPTAAPGQVGVAPALVDRAAGNVGVGYVMAASDGSSYSFSGAGVARTGAMALTRPIVGMASTADGGGYWLVASDGGVFSFGDARFFGSTGAVHLNEPIVGMASTADGGGYWLVASDGGVFSFGDARFFGSTGAIHLNRPISGMTRTPDSWGYWLVASDGGVFTFGDATFYGSGGGGAVSAPVVAISRPTSGPLPAPPNGNAAEFDQPSGLAFANGDLWVTNRAGNSLTEIAPTTPASWVGTYFGSSYGFSAPVAVAAYDTDLFVANAGGSVSEVSALDGSAVRVIAGPGYGFSNPVAIAVSGSTLLVLNSGGSGGSGSITEIDADTGALIGVVSGPAYSFSNPVAMAVVGPDVYVADEGSNSVTHFIVAGGALAWVITGGGLSSPDGISSGSGYVWVSNSTANTATRITASTDTPVLFSNGSYGFGAPSAMAESGGYIYVLSPYGWSPMVTKIEEVTGSPSWYMCNSNGPYYFSNLSAITIGNGDVWVASSNGANYPDPRAANGSLTEFLASDGSLVQTVP
jgi:hypothetical protein